MTKKLIDHLVKGDISLFKDNVESILQSKIVEKLQEKKEDVIQELANQDVKDFFYMAGAEDCMENEDMVSAIFPNKTALQYAIDQLPDYIEYDIYYWPGAGAESTSDLPYFPDIDKDDEDQDVVPIELDDVPDADPDDAFELVIYKDDDGDYDQNESYIFNIQEGSNTFSKEQIAQLKAEFGKIKKVDPNSPTLKKMEKFLTNLSPEARKQLEKENVPWLRTILSRSKFSGLNEGIKRFDFKGAKAYFDPVPGKTKVADPLWDDEDPDMIMWLQPESGEVVLAKEKTKPAGAKRYSGNIHKPVAEGWGAAAQKRALEKAKKERDEYADKLKGDKGKLKIYDAWTTYGTRGSVAYEKAMKGLRHPLMAESKKDGLSRKFNKMLSWNGTPQEMMKRIKSYSDKELISLYNAVDDEKAPSGSARRTQTDLIKREIQRRFGVKPGSKNWDNIVIGEANENESGRAIKRRVSYAKKRRGGQLVRKRNRRRKGKISQGAGKGYRTKGAGWKTKLIKANRKRKITKRKNVKAQKMGKRFAARSRNIRKKLGYRAGT